MEAPSVCHDGLVAVQFFVSCFPIVNHIVNQANDNGKPMMKKEIFKTARFVMCAMVACTVLAVGSSSHATAIWDKTAEMWETDGVSPPPGELEEKLYGEPAEGVQELIREAVREPRPGARQALYGAEIKPVNLRGLIAEADEVSLRPRAATKAVEAADAGVRRSDAAFDPVLLLSLSYGRDYSYKRDAWISRMYGALLKDPEDFETEGGLPCVFIDGVLVNADASMVDEKGNRLACYEPEYYDTRLEYASGESDLPTTLIGTLGLTKAFHWGASSSLSLNMTRRIKDTYATKDMLSPISESDPFGWGSRMPWTTNLSLDFSMPLPFTRGFGSDASSLTVQKRLAERNAHRARAVEGDVRLKNREAVALNYWELVRAFAQLEALMEHREAMEDRERRVLRQLDLGFVTAYDADLVTLELGTLRNREEIAWNLCLARSNELKGLLADGSNKMLLPVGAQDVLATDLPMDVLAGGEGFERAMTHHPAAMAAEEVVAAAGIERTFREKDMLPDLAFGAGLVLGQTDVVYGYEHAWSSLGNIFSPDQRDVAVMIRFRLPFGKKEMRAALTRSQIAERQARDDLTLVRNRLATDLDAARGNLDAVLSRVRRVEQELDLAQFAYGSTLEWREEALVDELELIDRYRDLLSARLAYIDIRIKERQAYVVLLSAQGLLSQESF